MNQGRHLDPATIARIVALLRTTDMSMSEVAARMGVHKQTIVRLNRVMKARIYGGNRSKWTQPKEAA